MSTVLRRPGRQDWRAESTPVELRVSERADPRYQAVRDFGLMLGALTLGRLASVYDRRTAPHR